jgi:hypothetical protein
MIADTPDPLASWKKAIKDAEAVDDDSIIVGINVVKRLVAALEKREAFVRAACAYVDWDGEELDEVSEEWERLYRDMETKRRALVAEKDPVGGGVPPKPKLPPNTLFCVCGREFNGNNAQKPCLLCRALRRRP